MWPPGSYSPRDLRATGLDNGATLAPPATAGSLPPTLVPTTLAGTPVPNAMTPPTYVTYQPSFEPFTTDQYMFPEQDSWSLTDLERFQVDNLVFEDIKIAESMLNHTHIPTSQRWWFSEFLPRVVYEWCFWFDRSITSEEVDAHMNNLMSNMLYQFHYHILDPTSGVRFSVMDLLQRVRAVRDRLHPNSRGLRWDDEWP